MAIEELQNGRYRRLRLLGSGGMGEVHLMQDTRVNRQVAIKVIRSEGTPYPNSDTSQDTARLFQREARAIAALDHPNILPLYDFGEEILEDTTITYMVMPFCPDGTLVGWMRQQGGNPQLSLQDVANLVEQAAEALQYGHDHQVIHLDVKPSNFLLRNNTKNPNHPRLLLADFGIARSSATAASSSRTIRGTPTSMAPEQWSSQPVPATDQYALAVMVYELLAGRPPFVGGMEQLMFQHFNTQPAPPSTFNPHLPAAIDSVLLRALAKKPEDRFPSITAFATAFERAVHLSSTELTIGWQQPSTSDSTADIRTTLAISQIEARSGLSRLITLPGGHKMMVAIPAEISDGQIIQLRGLDESGNPGGTVILTIAVKQSEEVGVLSDIGTIQAPHTLPHSGQQPFDPISDHNLPTLASSAPGIQAPERPQPPQPKKRPVPLARFVSILSGLIVLLLIAGSVIYFYSSRQSSSQQASATATAHSLTATAATLAQTPKVTITPTATPQNGLYIAGTYNGSMFNQTTQQASNISVKIVQSQGSGVLSGTFTFTSPAQGAYPLNGTVDTQGNFSFTVQQPTGQTPLYFYGAVQQSVYLHGNFCNSSTSSCSTNTGYFTAGPKF